MTEIGGETPQESRKTRVKFGRNPWQTIPHDCAEWILTKWKDTDPKRFGDMLRASLMRDGDER